MTNHQDQTYRGPVRYNREDFGFIVGFPSGDIVLTDPRAMLVLNPEVTRAEVEPFLLESIPLPDGFYLSTPPLLWVELTRRCDLACPHCYVDAGRARSSELPTQRWFELIDEIAEMGVWAVAFTGGEPTLHPDFVEIVHRARSRGLLVGIATHGLFLTDDLLTALPDEGVIISVSVDELHVRRRQDEVMTSGALLAILRAKDHGYLTNIMTNTNRLNIGGLSAMMNWAEQEGVSIRSVPFSPIGRGKLNRGLENTVEDVDAAAEFWVRECQWEHEYHRQAGLCVGIIFNYGLTLAYMTRRCSSGRFLAYIAADGTVYPCTMCVAENIFAAGSVRERDFSAVWHDRWEIRQYSWDNFEQTCAGCPINKPEYYCSGRCPAMSHARHGSYSDCGSSAFEIESTIRRTAMLEHFGVAHETFAKVETNTELPS